LTRQKAETDIRALELKLEDARKRASECAARDSRSRNRSGSRGDEGAGARDAELVVDAMRRELEAETAASEAAAAESARREGVSRRKLAGAEEKLKEASAALAEAARRLDARDTALRRSDEEKKRLAEQAERAERRARRAEDVLALKTCGTRAVVEE
jgi:predicted ribosome quality control (RQC) complex YloA/Tae2 family protein